MGQRTQVLQVIKTDLPQLGDNQLLSTQFVHNQWGFGKVMPLLLISQLTKVYSMDFRLYNHNKGDDSEINEIDTLFKEFCQSMQIPVGAISNYSPVYCEDNTKQERQAIDDILNATYDELPTVINKYGDNNDGYMIMVFTLKPHPQYTGMVVVDVETAFINNDGKHSKYLSAEDYMKQYIYGDDNYNIRPIITALDNIVCLWADDFDESSMQWVNFKDLKDSETLKTFKPFKPND